jgi:hypothetical protein
MTAGLIYIMKVNKFDMFQSFGDERGSFFAVSPLVVGAMSDIPDQAASFKFKEFIDEFDEVGRETVGIFQQNLGFVAGEFDQAAD